MSTLTDKRGRVKRRGNFQPWRGKAFRVVPIPHPQDWATHYCELDGVAYRDALGHLLASTEQGVREIAYRRGADEVER